MIIKKSCVILSNKINYLTILLENIIISYFNGIKR